MSMDTISNAQTSHPSVSNNRISRYWVGLLLAAILSFLADESVSAAETVNINTADVATLVTELSGVGPKLAGRIVEFRERHGDFETLEAIKDVKGVGQALLLKNADKIVLD